MPTTSSEATPCAPPVTRRALPAIETSPSRNPHMTSRKLLLLLAWLTALPVFAQSLPAPKREFRGAWIQCVNGQFHGLGRDRMQATLTHQLDRLKACGINAIIFQVRAEADALYESPYEPWSRYLTGQQGRRPDPYWDPLEWMIRECHARGMELHAWINPYRAKTKGTTELARNHPYLNHRSRFFAYDGQLFFDPGLEENRRYICRIASDIVRRYDVDGLHMDDYFYPYPAAGQSIPDDATFRAHSDGIADRGDWRRRNVSLLIEALHDSIRAVKPWVKFGVSPFGIYHNARPGSNIPGSATRGLQNYDDLYADVLLWADKGWVDYLLPQLYWEIGHKAADYETLVKWWARYAGSRPLFIGQDVLRTAKAADPVNPGTNQMARKMRLQRSQPTIGGSCQWYAAAVVDNPGNYAAALEHDYHRYPALQPRMPFIDDKAPRKPRKLKDVWTADGYLLFWTAPKAKRPMDEARQYVVYRFAKGEKVTTDDPSHIVAITDKTYYKLPYDDGRTKYTYVVTALDRLQNESKATKKKVKL